jgi:arylsulfatase A-like enzyme
LREAGYTTAGFSTSPLLSRNYGYEKNFDKFVDLNPGERDPSLRRIRGGHFLLQKSITHHLSRLVGVRTRPAKIYSSAEELTNQVHQWIGENKEPFFIWAHYMDAHWPYHLEESLTQPNQITQAWKDVVHLHDANWNGAVITPEQQEHYIDLYERAVAYTDVQLGKLLDYLSESGLDQNTIIILLSDHGEEFLEHGRWGHWENNLHDEILKVPLIIRVPGISEEIVVDKQVRLLDIMPTLLDICDIPLPDGLLGTSFSSLWGDNSQPYNQDFSISEMWRDEWHIIAVRTEGKKLVWDNKKPGEYELFNLESDQSEIEDVYKNHIPESEILINQVKRVLANMNETKPDKSVSEPELSDEVVARLRDLGYME